MVHSTEIRIGSARSTEQFERRKQGSKGWFANVLLCWQALSLSACGMQPVTLLPGFAAIESPSVWGRRHG